MLASAVSDCSASKDCNFAHHEGCHKSDAIYSYPQDNCGIAALLDPAPSFLGIKLCRKLNSAPISSGRLLR